MAGDLASLLGELAPDLARIVAPADRARPVVLPAYGAARAGPNLTALVALMLKRFGVAVLVHGRIDGAGGPAGVTTAAVLRELGIAPAATLAEAQAQLARESFAFVPVDIVAPGLARRLRASGDAHRDGLAFAVAQVVDPFGGTGFRVACAASAETATALRDFFARTRADALLVANAEGDPFPDAAHPRLEAFAGGVPSEVADVPAAASGGALPADDAAATAAWIREALDGAVPVPDAVVAEIGTCLEGARRIPARR